MVFRQHIDVTGKGHGADVAAKEFHVTSHLTRDGFRVPAPLALHGDDVVDGPWLVTEWVRGDLAVGRTNDDQVVRQMVDFIARLHDLEPCRFDVPGLDHIEDPAAALPGYLPEGPTGRDVRRALEGGLRRTPNPSGLLHGDFWPGNVMLDHGSLVAVLDWEDAARGDPLADLACARVELACDGGSAVADRFTDLYCETRPDLLVDDLALWDVYVSATALSAMHRWGLSEQDEATRRERTHAFFEDAVARLLR